MPPSLRLVQPRRHSLHLTHSPEFLARHRRRMAACAGMMSYAITHGIDAAQFIQADFLRTVRNAVVGFLLIVFLLGALVGFFIGRAFGKRR